MIRVEGEPCFLLHLRAYRESSALLEVFSLEHGRLSMVAKGLRGAGRGRQHWRSDLQKFNLISLSWTGRGELKTLTDVQLQRRFALRERALFCGFYINELLERLLHRFDPHPALFHHYQFCLEQLAAACDEQLCLRRFEFALLAELGYGFSFEYSSDGQSLREDRRYGFDPEEGFYPMLNEGKAGFSGSDILKIGSDELDEAALRASLQISRLALSYRLGAKPLRSRELFAAVFANGVADISAGE